MKVCGACATILKWFGFRPDRRIVSYGTVDCPMTDAVAMNGVSMDVTIISGGCLHIMVSLYKYPHVLYCHSMTLRTLTALLVVLIPAISYAGHKSYVESVIIDSDDRGIYERHEGTCEYRHYHGTLNGIADPAPKGCGHGEVKLIVHGNGDGESIPPPPAKSAWTQFAEWVGSFFTKENRETIGNVVDVAAEANGIPPPNQIGELVDITKEMTPQIVEKTENIKAYRESVSEVEDTLGVYTDLDKVSENPTLSERFFRWFNSLVP